MTPESGGCIDSGSRSLDSLRSLQSGFTPESGGWSLSGVCSHSGVCSLELLRSLESRVTPEAVVWSLLSFRVCSMEEFEVTQESGVCIHSGAPNLKSRRSLESRTIRKYRWSLDVVPIM